MSQQKLWIVAVLALVFALTGLVLSAVNMGDQHKTEKTANAATKAEVEPDAEAADEFWFSNNKPNVILMLVDDMAYAQVCAHGDPYMCNVQLPNHVGQGGTQALDQLYADGVRMTDFHTTPLCTPTRATLQTGRYSERTGGISQVARGQWLRRDETTIAKVFKKNGYKTYFSGKWNKGMTPGFRPFERGYDEALWFKDAAVSFPDNAWNFDFLFDYVLFRNEQPERYTGTIAGETFVTKTLMDDTLRFIDEMPSHKRFFMSLNPVAPHWPTREIPAYRDAFKAVGLPGWSDLSSPYANTGVRDATNYGTLAEYYAGVSLVDEQVQRLRDHLQAKGLTDKTLIVFMSDNGVDDRMIEPGNCAMNPPGFANFIAPVAATPTNTGAYGQYYDAGLRGIKAQPYEGSHRAVSFWYWPNGGLTGGRDVDTLGFTIDVMPTVMDLANLFFTNTNYPMDGVSFADQLKNAPNGGGQDPSRVRFTANALPVRPFRYFSAVAMWTDQNGHKWRAVSPTGDVPASFGIQSFPELYDLSVDPQQTTNVAADPANAATLAFLDAQYQAFYADTEAEWFDADRSNQQRIVMGANDQVQLMTPGLGTYIGTQQRTPVGAYLFQNGISVFFGRVPSHANGGLGELNLDRSNKPIVQWQDPVPAGHPELTCELRQTIAFGAIAEFSPESGISYEVTFARSGLYEFQMRRFGVDRSVTNTNTDPGGDSPDYINFIRPYDAQTPIGFGYQYSEAIVVIDGRTYTEPIITGSSHATVTVLVTTPGPVNIQLLLRRQGIDPATGVASVDPFTGAPLNDRDTPFTYIRRIGE